MLTIKAVMLDGPEAYLITRDSNTGEEEMHWLDGCTERGEELYEPPEEPTHFGIWCTAASSMAAQQELERLRSLPGANFRESTATAVWFSREALLPYLQELAEAEQRPGLAS